MYCSYSGPKRGQIKYEHTSMNQGNTIKAIKHIVIPCVEQAQQLQHNIEFEIEGDNATAHTGKKMRKFINSRALPIPHTPFGGHPIRERGGRAANSPDLCAIEYVFGRWSENVYKRKATTMVQLKKICEEEWEKISQSTIQKMFKHMLKVYPWVVANNGEQYPSSK